MGEVSETETQGLEENDSSSPSPPLTEREKAELIQQGLLFQQLLQSDRFKAFFNVFYDLRKDEDTKTMYLVEVPDEISMKRVARLHATSQDVSIVASATDKDVKQELEIAKAAKKFR